MDRVDPDEQGLKSPPRPLELYEQFTEYGLTGLNDRNGVEVLAAEYESIWNVESPYMGNYSELYFARQSGRSFLYEVGKGRLTVEDYESIECIQGGTMIAFDSDKYFLLDKSGYRICQERFDLIYDLSYKNQEIFLVACNNEQCGLADRNGKLLSEMSFDHISDLEENVFLAESDGKFGILNQYGELDLDVVYDELKMYKENAYFAKKDGFVSLINEKGEPYFESEFVRMRDANEGLLVVRNEEYKVGYVDLNGEVIAVPKYDGGSVFTNGKAMVSKDKKIGVIDSEGTVVINLEYLFLRPHQGGFRGSVGDLEGGDYQHVYFDADGNCIKNCEFAK